MLLLLVAKPIRFLGFLEDWEVVSSFRKKKYFFVKGNFLFLSGEWSFPLPK